MDSLRPVRYSAGQPTTATPESQGIPSGAILRFLQTLEGLDVDIHSLYIFRRGYQVVGATRRPYRPDMPRRIYSAAKAITGLAILFAMQEGLVSLDDHITDLFPEDLPQVVTPRMRAMTVSHLLTMTTGHDRDTFRSVLEGESSVRAFLEQPLDFEPGTRFLYNNGVPHILGLVVQRVAGTDYLDYLRPRLLEPLGIHCTVERTQRGELEGSRTMCTADGFARLALFYLQEGNWDGRQLLDRALVRAAVVHQVNTQRCSSISFPHTDQLMGYGFQLWRNTHEGARLDGGRSQVGFLFPDQETAIVCNALEEDSGLIPTVLWATLYPAMTDGTVEEREDGVRLTQYLDRWSCAPKLFPQPSFLDDYYGHRYLLEDSPWGLRQLTLFLRDGAPGVTMETAQECCTLRVGTQGEWERNETFLSMPMENERLDRNFQTGPVSHWVSGGWASDFCFVFQVRSTHRMDPITFYCRFNGTRLSLLVESYLGHQRCIRHRIPVSGANGPTRPIEGVREAEQKGGC